MISISRAGSKPVPTVRKPNPAEQEQLFAILKKNLPAARRFFKLMQIEGFAAYGYRPTSLFLGRKLVSNVSTIEMNINGSEGLLKGMGISNVATRASHQGKGFVRHLLRAVLNRVDSKGYIFAVLFSNKPAVYIKHGFKAARQGNYVLDCECPQAQLSAAAATLTVAVKRELRAEDETIMRRLYEQGARTHFGTLHRDYRAWKTYFASYRFQPQDRILFLSRQGAVIGYARIRFEDGAVILGEMYCPAEAEALSFHLLSHICSRVAKRKRVRKVVLALPRTHELIRWLKRKKVPLEEGMHSEREVLMFRLNPENEKHLNRKLLTINWCLFDTF